MERKSVYFKNYPLSHHDAHFENMKGNFAAKICVIYWLLTFVSYLLYAQQQGVDTTKIHEIESVTIAAPQQIEIVPAQKFSGEELHKLSSHSVADAIRFFSGTQIKDFGGIGGLKTVDLRSMGSNHLGVFYDGVSLGNAQNGTVDLGKFSLDIVEEISLYNGQKSEIFQPAKDFGSAGAIYLTTRRPTFAENKNSNFRMLFRTGSFGLANPSVLWEQRLSGGEAVHCVSTSVNAEYIYATGKYKFRYWKEFPDGTVAYDTSAIRKNGDIHALRLECGVFGNGEKLKWNAKTYFYNSERGIPGAIVNNVWSSAQRQWDRNFFTQASLLAPINDSYKLLAHFKYAYDYLRYSDPDTIFKQIDNSYLQQEIYTSLSHKVNLLKKWEISMATDFQWNALRANLYNFAPSNRYTTLAALATAFEIWRIKALASVLGSFFYDTVDRSGIIGYFPEDSLFSTRSHSFKYKFTPSVFISYKPMKKEELYLMAFYKHVFRMPTFNDLYYTDLGYSTLRPEYATQYNVGVQYTKFFEKGLIERMLFKTDAYYNIIKDKIIAVPKENTLFRWEMSNIGLVKIRGVDAAAQLNWRFKYDIRLQMSINYTYQKAQDFSPDSDPIAYGGQIPYIPWHTGSFTLNFAFKTYELNTCFIYMGERYRNSANIPAKHIQPWYTHDLSLGKEFCFPKWNFKVSAEVNNILNQQFEVVWGYPMPGTNFRIVLKFEI